MPLLCILFLAINAFSQIISLECGINYFPEKDLRKEIKPAPYIGTENTRNSAKINDIAQIYAKRIKNG